MEDAVDNNKAPMLIRPRMNDRIDDRILFGLAVRTFVFLPGSFIGAAVLSNEKTN